MFLTCLLIDTVQHAQSFRGHFPRSLMPVQPFFHFPVSFQKSVFYALFFFRTSLSIQIIPFLRQKFYSFLCKLFFQSHPFLKNRFFRRHKAAVRNGIPFPQTPYNIIGLRPNIFQIIGLGHILHDAEPFFFPLFQQRPHRLPCIHTVISVNKKQTRSFQPDQAAQFFFLRLQILIQMIKTNLPSFPLKRKKNGIAHISRQKAFPRYPRPVPYQALQSKRNGRPPRHGKRGIPFSILFDFFQRERLLLRSCPVRNLCRIYFINTPNLHIQLFAPRPFFHFRYAHSSL